MSAADESQEEEAEDEAGQDEDERPYVGSYTAEDMAEARITLTMAGDPPDDDEPEPYSDVSDPEVLRKELRVAWAYIHRMEARHREQLAQRLAKGNDTVTVFGKPARRQSLLFGLKKPSQSVEIDALHARPADTSWLRDEKERRAVTRVASGGQLMNLCSGQNEAPSADGACENGF